MDKTSLSSIVLLTLPQKNPIIPAMEGTQNARRKILCRLCGADNSGDLENLLKINSCMNCKIDITCKGDWTAEGWTSWLVILEKHGEENIKNYLADHFQRAPDK